MPLTSNLRKWKSKLHFCLDFQIIFYVGQFFLFCFPQLTQFGMGGFDFFFFSLLWIPFLSLNCDPLCFLLGECIGFSPPPESGSTPFSPTKNSAEPFSPLTQGRGWRVCGTLMCPEAALWLLWRLVQFQGMFGFPASCGLLLRYCIDCNIMLHVQDEQ